MNSSKILNKWINKLRLTDWTIILNTNCEPTILVNQGNAAEVNYQEVHKCAVINIVDKKYYGEDRMVPFDLEHLIVHELLHLKFCLFQETGSDFIDRYVHILIEEFAKILMENNNELKPN